MTKQERDRMFSLMATRRVEGGLTPEQHVEMDELGRKYHEWKAAQSK